MSRRPPNTAEMPGRVDDGALIDALSEAAREAAAHDAGPGPTPAVWHRLQDRLGRLGRIDEIQPRGARRSRPSWRGLLLAGAGVAAACAVLLVARGVQRGRPVSYVVEEAVEQDGYIRGGGDGVSHVRFSDGTHVDLDQGARVSVLSRGPRGARLRVEEGRAHFDVAHLPHASWSVEAGPYVVYVTGTVFDVRWSGSDEVIDVRMHSGSVQVGGPLLPERVTLRGGQHLTAKLATGELHIDNEGRGGAPDAQPGAARSQPAAAVPSSPAENVGPVPGPAPAVAAAPALPPPPPLPEAAPAPTEVAAPQPPPPAVPAVAPVPEAAVASAPPSPAAPAAAPARLPSLAHRAAHANPAAAWSPRTWSAEVISGNAARVLAEADAHGLDRTLLEVDAKALVALADASRYSSRPELAVRALVAQRQRFPNTASAHTAAFLLGRLADDRGEVAAGLAWYRRYLSEVPNGPYAAEALGRKMLAVERISGRDAARSVAAEYVGRFPDGTYMLQAHAILSNPTE